MIRKQQQELIEMETVQVAEYIIEHKLTLREAENALNIPRQTLYWRIKNVLPRCNSTLLTRLENMFEENKNKLFEKEN